MNAIRLVLVIASVLLPLVTSLAIPHESEAGAEVKSVYGRAYTGNNSLLYVLEQLANPVENAARECRGASFRSTKRLSALCEEQHCDRNACPPMPVLDHPKTQSSNFICLLPPTSGTSETLTQAEHAATLIPDVVRTFHKYLNAGSIHRKDPRFSASRLDFPRTDGRFVPTAPKSGATRVLPKGERLLEKLRTKLKRFGTFQCLAPTSGSLQSRAPKQSV